MTNSNSSKLLLTSDKDYIDSYLIVCIMYNGLKAIIIDEINLKGHYE